VPIPPRKSSGSLVDQRCIRRSSPASAVPARGAQVLLRLGRREQRAQNRCQGGIALAQPRGCRGIAGARDCRTERQRWTQRTEHKVCRANEICRVITCAEGPTARCGLTRPRPASRQKERPLPRARRPAIQNFIEARAFTRRTMNPPFVVERQQRNVRPDARIRPDRRSAGRETCIGSICRSRSRNLEDRPKRLAVIARPGGWS